MKDKLKPCPCCGGKAIWFTREKNSGYYYRCSNGDITQMKSYKTLKQAKTAWNKRDYSELIDIQIAGLPEKKNHDLSVYDSVKIKEIQSAIDTGFNNAIDELIANLLKQKGEKMSNDRRPEYPRCVMTPEIIRRIRSDQEVWDR